MPNVEDQKQTNISSSYLDVKEKQIKTTSTRILHGVPLANMGRRLGLGDFKVPFPIIGCLCVQDSPDNPCPCIDLPIWINTLPIDISKTGKKHPQGKDIVEFILPKEAEVFVDLQVPFKLKDLELIARNLRQRRKHDCDEPTVMNAPPLNWLSLAAAIGYGVGRVLDDLAGSNEGGNDNLSDDISDWAAENFPAPDWLKDL